jgi:hypothetical protein
MIAGDEAVGYAVRAVLRDRDEASLHSGTVHDPSGSRKGPPALMCRIRASFTTRITLDVQIRPADALIPEEPGLRPLAVDVLAGAILPPPA